jgi:hypothetical protein
MNRLTCLRHGIRDGPRRSWDELDDAERAELHKALAESQENIKAGRLVDAADVLKGLRSR